MIALEAIPANPSRFSLAPADSASRAAGAGNIGPDTTTYVDGGIHRQGDPAETGGAYSAGVSSLLLLVGWGFVQGCRKVMKFGFGGGRLNEL